MKQSKNDNRPQIENLEALENETSPKLLETATNDLQTMACVDTKVREISSSFEK